MDLSLEVKKKMDLSLEEKKKMEKPKVAKPNPYSFRFYNEIIFNKIYYFNLVDLEWNWRKIKNIYGVHVVYPILKFKNIILFL